MLVENLFLDTSAIEHFVKKGYSVDFFNTKLSKKYHIFVGVYVTYELAKKFMSSKKEVAEEAKQSFQFLKSLSFYLPHRHDVLEKKELEKLIRGTSVNFLLKECGVASHEARQLIDALASGNLTKKNIRFIKEREHLLQISRNNWNRDPNKTEIYRQYGKNQCEKFINDVMREPNFKVVKWIQENFRKKIVKEEIAININDFLNNLRSYPALTTFIRSMLFLEFLTQKNKEPPAMDKFTDSLIATEASYCSIFVSEDYDLINKNLQLIAPNLKGITATDFMEAERFH